MATNVLEKALKTLQKYEQATRGDLDLNFPQMKRLVEDGYVKEVGYAEPEGRGRPPMVYELTKKGIKAIREGIQNGERRGPGRPPGSKGRKTAKGKATAKRATGKGAAKAKASGRKTVSKKSGKPVLKLKSR
jgi:hypothetical protein